MSSQVASLFATIGADASGAISEIGKLINSLKGAKNEADIYSAEMQKKLGLDKGMFTQQTEGANKTASAWNNIASAVKGVITVAAIYQAGKFFYKAMKESIAYADEVRNVARVTGATAEESSRLIQVANMVGVTTDALTTSMQQAVKKGYDPTIASLMKMSSEYSALMDPMQKITYLQEHFASSGGAAGGAKMAALLELGPEKIKELGAGVTQSLILSNADLFRSRQTSFALNNLEDTYKGVIQTIGSGISTASYSFFNDPKTKASALLEYAGILNKAGTLQTDFTKSMNEMAYSMGMMFDEAGNLRERHGRLFEGTVLEINPENQDMVSAGFMDAARNQKEVATNSMWLSEADKKNIQLVEEQKLKEAELKNEIRYGVAAVMLKNAVTDDGVSIYEKYRSKMDELVEQEKEFQSVLDEGTRKHWNARGKKMTEAAEGLAEVVKTQEELQDQFRQQYGTGIMNTMLTGGMNTTPRTGMDVANALGLVDEKTFGIESAIYDIADAWDGATDGIVDFSKWTEKTYNNLGDLKDIGLEATEGLPTGGQAEFYYNIIVTTYHRTSGGGDWAYSYSSGGKPADSGGANLYGPQGMHGGSFIGLQHGGIVMPGYGNDGAMIRVSSGEKITAEPAGNKNIEGDGKPVYKFYGNVTLKVGGKNADFLRNFQQ